MASSSRGPGVHPLILTPILKPKVWGGRRLERLGKRLPPEGAPDALIGESWELADLASTSASGGGGEAARSVVARGAHAGRTLHEMMDEWGDDLLPRHLRAASGDFPLLVKFLDAREHLSIQVHPSSAYASKHPDAHLKTECWFVLDAQGGPARRPGDPARPPALELAPAAHAPVIYKGLRPGVTPDLFRRLIAQGRVPEAMLAVPAIVGQMHDLPSGTVHALGAGVLVAEVQTPSDTTFRVYDWAKEYGRTGRALHVEQSLECMDFGPAPAASALPAGERAGTLVANRFYRVDQVRIGSGESLCLGDPGCQVLMVLEGSGTIAGGGGLEPVAMALGDTVVLPAAIASQATIVADSAINLLRVGLGA